MATKIAGVGIKMLSSALGGGGGGYEGGGYEYEYDMGGSVEGFDPSCFCADGSDPTAAYY